MITFAISTIIWFKDILWEFRQVSIRMQLKFKLMICYLKPDSHTTMTKILKYIHWASLSMPRAVYPACQRSDQPIQSSTTVLLYNTCFFKYNRDMIWHGNILCQHTAKFRQEFVIVEWCIYIKPCIVLPAISYLCPENSSVCRCNEFLQTSSLKVQYAILPCQ